MDANDSNDSDQEIEVIRRLILSLLPNSDNCKV
jgi:hypothetical protein